jgi:hypothetical protein
LHCRGKRLERSTQSARSVIPARRFERHKNTINILSNFNSFASVNFIFAEEPHHGQSQVLRRLWAASLDRSPPFISRLMSWERLLLPRLRRSGSVATGAGGKCSKLGARPFAPYRPPPPRYARSSSPASPPQAGEDEEVAQKRRAMRLRADIGRRGPYASIKSSVALRQSCQGGLAEVLAGRDAQRPCHRRAIFSDLNASILTLRNTA